MINKYISWEEYRKTCTQKFKLDNYLCDHPDCSMWDCEEHTCPLFKKDLKMFMMNNPSIRNTPSWAIRSTTVNKSGGTAIFNDEMSSDCPLSQVIRHHLLRCKSTVSDVSMLEIRPKTTRSFKF